MLVFIGVLGNLSTHEKKCRWVWQSIFFLHTIAEKKCSEQFGYPIDSVDTSTFCREINKIACTQSKVRV